MGRYINFDLLKSTCLFSIYLVDDATAVGEAVSEGDPLFLHQALKPRNRPSGRIHHQLRQRRNDRTEVSGAISLWNRQPKSSKSYI